MMAGRRGYVRLRKGIVEHWDKLNTRQYAVFHLLLAMQIQDVPKENGRVGTVADVVRRVRRIKKDTIYKTVPELAELEYVRIEPDGVIWITKPNPIQKRGGNLSLVQTDDVSTTDNVVSGTDKDFSDTDRFVSTADTLIDQIDHSIDHHNGWLFSDQDPKAKSPGPKRRPSVKRWMVWDDAEQCLLAKPDQESQLRKEQFIRHWTEVLGSRELFFRHKVDAEAWLRDNESKRLKIKSFDKFLVKWLKRQVED